MSQYSTSSNVWLTPVTLISCGGCGRPPHPAAPKAWPSLPLLELKHQSTKHARRPFESAQVLNSPATWAGFAGGLDFATSYAFPKSGSRIFAHPGRQLAKASHLTLVLRSDWLIDLCIANSLSASSRHCFGWVSALSSLECGCRGSRVRMVVTCSLSY